MPDGIRWVGPDYPHYLDLVVPKLTPRGIIVADSLFRDGATLPPATDDEATRGVLDFARRVQEHERLHKRAPDRRRRTAARPGRHPSERSLAPRGRSARSPGKAAPRV